MSHENYEGEGIHAHMQTEPVGCAGKKGTQRNQLTGQALSPSAERHEKTYLASLGLHMLFE